MVSFTSPVNRYRVLNAFREWIAVDRKSGKIPDTYLLKLDKHHLKSEWCVEMVTEMLTRQIIFFESLET